MSRETKNPESLDGCEDMSSLIYLDKESVRFNLKYRFNDHKPYTNISNILIAVNPYKFYDGIYGNEQIENIKNFIEGKSNNKPESNIYFLAGNAYQNLKYNSINQSLLVCGESGSGKTENSKRLMEYKLLLFFIFFFFPKKTFFILSKKKKMKMTKNVILNFFKEFSVL